MIRKTFAILAASLLVSSSAFAADVVSEAPIVEQPIVFSWTGAYVGGQIGYGWGQSDLDSDFGSTSFDPDGFLGGVHAGYNYQFSNNVVLGIEADVDYSDMDGDGDFDVAGFSGSSELDWQGSVRARLGYAYDRVLPYLTGGVAFGKYEHRISDGVDSFSDDDTYVGWTIGAGLEYAMTDNWTVRGEYRYTDFGDQDFNFGGADYNVDLQTHAVKLGVSYKF